MTGPRCVDSRLVAVEELTLGVRVQNRDKSYCRGLAGCERSNATRPTVWGDFKPDVIIAKGVLVSIKGFERTLGAQLRLVFPIQRGVLMMAKGHGRTLLAGPVGFDTLATLGFLFIAFEFACAAC
jgi:hypothetical protein